MEFKVILFNIFDAGDTDSAGNFEFYTYDEASLCCSEWVTISSGFKAYMWTGTSWRYFD